MRVMLKMKKSDPTKLNTSRSTPATKMKLEDHRDPKEPTSSPMEETANSNSNSINNTSSNNNTPIRVCSDCNTTKTPLWRSGPQGPKVYIYNTKFFKIKPKGLDAPSYPFSLL